MPFSRQRRLAAGRASLVPRGKAREILRERNLPEKGNNTLFIGTKGMLLCDFGSRQLLPKEKFADFQAPRRSIADSPGFHNEFIAACKGGKPATCTFDYSGPLAETVMLGNVAYRVGGFEWDAQSLRPRATRRRRRCFASRSAKAGKSTPERAGQAPPALCRRLSLSRVFANGQRRASESPPPPAQWFPAPAPPRRCRRRRFPHRLAMTRHAAEHRHVPGWALISADRRRN